MSSEEGNPALAFVIGLVLCLPFWLLAAWLLS